MKLFISLFLLSVSCFLLAHDGHEHLEEGVISWFQRIGSLHLFFLHFPIALINMLIISEVLLVWVNRPLFDFSARFLAYAAAIASLPTVFLGLVYSYSASYEGLMELLLWWHMWLGILTAVFALIVLWIRETLVRGRAYYCCLLVLFLLVNLAGYFGAGMTFGPSMILLE